MMYDVIVVGSGVAGSVASYILAKRGFNVLLLEKDKYPRRKPCGGGLSRRTLHLLKEIGLYSEKYITHRVEKSVLVFHKIGEKFILDAGGALTTRELFDMTLALSARDAGAELHEGVFVKDARVKTEFVEVDTVKGHYRGKALILASGYPSPIATRLGIKPKSKPAVAYEFDAPLADGLDPKYTYFYMNLEWNMMGYFWAFPKGDFVNYGVGTWVSTAKSMVKRYGSPLGWMKKIIKDLGLEIPELESRLKTLNGHLLPIYWGSKPEDFVRNRVVAVGDTAGLVDFKGEGISSAISSARIVADAFSILLEKGLLAKHDIVSTISPRLEMEVLEELKVTPILELALRKLPKTASKLLKEDEEARLILSKMIEHSIDSHKGYEKIKSKMLRYFGTAILEILRPSIL